MVVLGQGALIRDDGAAVFTSGSSPKRWALFPKTGTGLPFCIPPPRASAAWTWASTPRRAVWTPRPCSAVAWTRSTFLARTKSISRSFRHLRYLPRPLWRYGLLCGGRVPAGRGLYGKRHVRGIRKVGTGRLSAIFRRARPRKIGKSSARSPSVLGRPFCDPSRVRARMVEINPASARWANGKPGTGAISASPAP